MRSAQQSRALPLTDHIGPALIYVMVIPSTILALESAIGSSSHGADSILVKQVLHSREGELRSSHLDDVLCLPCSSLGLLVSAWLLVLRTYLILSVKAINISIPLPYVVRVAHGESDTHLCSVCFNGGTLLLVLKHLRNRIPFDSGPNWM